MKKAFLVMGSAFLIVLSASAQAKKQPPPPPPPPPPPAVAKKLTPPPPPPVPAEPLPPPVITKMPDDFNAFLKRNPNVAMVEWNENEVIISLKKGKREHYSLDEKGIAQAEAKYGKLPTAPPPPPAPPEE